MMVAVSKTPLDDEEPSIRLVECLSEKLL